MKHVLFCTQGEKKFKNVFLGVVSLLVLVFVSSCSLNLPTLKKDVQHTANKVGDTVNDWTSGIREKFNPETNDLIDEDAHLSKKDIRDIFTQKNGSVAQDIPLDPVLPDVSSLLIEPRPPIIGQDKLVSISVTEDVPLKDVILELARRAEVDVEIDPGIRGGIIFRAKDKPFSEVIERIADLSGLRYSIKGDVLRFERDTPYVVNYRVSILNMIRSNSSTVNLNTQVLSGGEGGGGSSFNSGAQSTLSTSYEGDVWQEIENTVNNILGNYSGAVTTVSQGAGGGFDPGTDEILGGAPAVQAGGGVTGQADESAVLSINRHAGIITILATDRQHREVKTYIDYVEESQSAQVLIEAKILEVNLSDEYRSGINWKKIAYGFNPSNVASGDFTTPFGTESNFFTFGIIQEQNLFGNDLDMDLSVQLLEKFGVVKTLSNPRINAMNNQQAVLTFAENKVYFEIDVQKTQQGVTTTQTNTVTVNSTVKTVPVGVMLTLQPSIDIRKNEITMNIRPTLSRITATVDDPGVATSVALINDSITGTPLSVTNSIPVIEVREIDSILKVKSGQVMVIGGLIEERTENEDRGVPGISDVPYIGRLFKSVKKVKSTIETVIFIKATIVPGYGVEQKDKEFYRTFSTDRRPLTF